MHLSDAAFQRCHKAFCIAFSLVSDAGLSPLLRVGMLHPLAKFVENLLLPFVVLDPGLNTFSDRSEPFLA